MVFNSLRPSDATHICASDGQAIFWTIAGVLLTRTLETNFSEIISEMHTFSFKKIHLKMSSAKWRPFCLGLNVLTHWCLVTHICVRELGHICFRIVAYRHKANNLTKGDLLRMFALREKKRKRKISNIGSVWKCRANCSNLNVLTPVLYWVAGNILLLYL